MIDGGQEDGGQPGSSESKIDEVLGARIRERRRALKMSQTELGERVGVSFQQVQKYENGSNRISAAALLRIAQALKMPPRELLDGYHGGDRKAQAPPLAPPLSQELLDAFSAISSTATRAGLVHLAAILATDYGERGGKR